MTQIVTVNVSQDRVRVPSQLQRKGLMVTQGGTNTAPGTVSQLLAKADLTPILGEANAIASITWLAGVATVTTVDPHGYTNGDNIPLTIAGAVPAAYNGTVTATITGASAFTYPLTPDPGVSPASTPGTYLDADVTELQQMVNTFYAQGSQAVWVLELGPSAPADGPDALVEFIDENPGSFYRYLVPRGWSDEASFITMMASYEEPNALTYFHATATLDNYGDFADVGKECFLMVEAPGKPATEFTSAAPFFWALRFQPSSTNKVTPFSYTYLYGVTAYPLAGNKTTLAALRAANVNVVGTGAEGGISNTILLYGRMKNGDPLTYWYSIDWAQVTLDQNVAAAVINGSNDPTNPLYFNQDGINQLQAVAGATMGNGVTYGLVLNPPRLTDLDPEELSRQIDAGSLDNVTVVNAQGFISYTAENPNDYSQGLYTGLTVRYTPQLGFEDIIINLNVTQFVS